MTEYRFNKEKHLHELLVDKKWKALTGVTTILGVIAKPALIQWAANMAVDYIRDKSIFYESTNEYKANGDILIEARKAHAKKKEDAGKKGTDVHAEIERFIFNAIKNNRGYIVGQSDNKQVAHFLKWSDKNNVKFLHTEKNIYSKKLFVGGICDFICEIRGNVWIGDIKTSNGIYPENFWQMAGYQLLIEEMGIFKDITGHIVVNLKKDGSFEEKRCVSNDDNKKAFLAALTIYRIKEKLEKII